MRRRPDAPRPSAARRPSAVASSATCTTARSSGSSAWRWNSARRQEHFDDEDKDAIRALVVHAHEEAKAALQEIRDLVRGIHPVILEDRGLDAALSAVVARAPIPVSLEVDVDPRPTPEVESAAYFVVSEALTNVATPLAAPPTPRSSLVRRGRHARDRGRATTVTVVPTPTRRHRPRRPARAGDVARRLASTWTARPAVPTILRAVLPCESMIAEDSVLLREGLTRLLVDAGEEVVAAVRRRRRAARRARRRATKTARPRGPRRAHAARPTPTRACAPRCRSATAGRRSASSCCRSTWRSGTRPSSSPATVDTDAGRRRLPAQGPRGRRARLRRRAATRRRRRHRRSTPRWSRSCSPAPGSRTRSNG